MKYGNCIQKYMYIMINRLKFNNYKRHQEGFKLDTDIKLYLKSFCLKIREMLRKTNSFLHLYL